jgi:hypothetical protein
LLIDTTVFGEDAGVSNFIQRASSEDLTAEKQKNAVFVKDLRTRPWFITVTSVLDGASLARLKNYRASSARAPTGKRW